MTTSKTHELTGGLAHFKARESVEQVFSLKDNLEAQRLIAAWPSARIRMLEVKLGRVPEEEAARWEWLWRQVEIDETELATLTGMSLPRVRAALALARGNRLIYPDGTVHEQATLFIRALVARDLGVKPTKAGRRPER